MLRSDQSHYSLFYGIEPVPLSFYGRWMFVQVQMCLLDVHPGWNDRVAFTARDRFCQELDAIFLEG